MIKVNPRKISGSWRDGYALDFHTISSTYVGDNEFGHPQFETERSEAGELLFRLKNRRDQSGVADIVAAAADFVQRWKPGIDIIVPVPPSTQRTVQPVILLAEGLGKVIGIPVANCVQLTRETGQLKNVVDFEERARKLDGLHAVDPNVVKGKRVLAFDDLYRSGATMNAVTNVLMGQGQAAYVTALTITQTRSNR
jgi:predicted amidophosphoribosyltransferase